MELADERRQNVRVLQVIIEFPHGRPIQQVQLGMRAADQAVKPTPLKFPPDRAADHAAMTRHIYPRVSGNIHVTTNKPA